MSANVAVKINDIRDWLAGLAMQALISGFATPAKASVVANAIAEDAYKFADAMLEARQVDVFKDAK